MRKRITNIDNLQTSYVINTQTNFAGVVQFSTSAPQEAFCITFRSLKGKDLEGKSLSREACL